MFSSNSSVVFSTDLDCDSEYNIFDQCGRGGRTDSDALPSFNLRSSLLMSSLLLIKCFPLLLPSHSLHKILCGRKGRRNTTQYRFSPSFWMDFGILLFLLICGFLSTTFSPCGVLLLLPLGLTVPPTEKKLKTKIPG